ncbi:MAG: response regulator [Anaerolineae bacterium]|nr:response regulator [Anaerolineae bacterium]
MSKTRILVVEDCEVLLMAMQDTLTAAGYAVETAPDGKQALEALDHASPQLVITDIQMPCMDGIALCHILHTSDQWAAVPLIFIFMSGRENKSCCESTGAVDFLPKPFDLEELLALVTHYEPIREL